MNFLKRIAFKSFRLLSRINYCKFGMIILVLWALYLRKNGINPQSLWLDDAWVALVGKVRNIEQLRIALGSSPIGFVLIIKCFTLIIPDPEISVQLLPLISSLLIIPLLGMALRRTTESDSLALLGSFAIAISPQIIDKSICVKQFTFDALIVSGFLLLVVVFLRKQEHGHKTVMHFSLFCIASLILGLFSYTSFFFSGVFIGIFFIKYMFLDYKKTQQKYGKNILIFIIYFSSLMLIYIFLLRGQTNTNLQKFWADSFLPLNSELSGIIRFYIIGMVNFITKAFPLFFEKYWGKTFLSINIGICIQFLITSFFIFLGFLYLFKNNKFKILGMSILLFYFVPLTLAAVRKYPFGVNATRVEIYSYPLTIFICLIGGYYLFTSIKEFIHEKCVLGISQSSIFHPEKMVRLPITLFFLLAIVILSWKGRRSVMYTEAEQCISEAVSIVEQNEGNVIVYPLSSMAFGYYTKEAVDFVSDSAYSSGFNVSIEKDNYFILPFIRGFRSDYSTLDESLNNIPYEEYDNLFYIASHFTEESSQYVENYILNSVNYRKEIIISSASCRLVKFTR